MKVEGSEASKSEYKTLIKKVKKACRSARANHERRLSKNRKTNPKAFYSYISSRTKIKPGVGPLRIDVNGKKSTW